MSDLPYGVYVILAGVLIYPVFAGLVLRFTRKQRMQFADLTCKILKDPTVSEKHKQLVCAMADDVFDWRFMAYAALVFPRAIFLPRYRGKMTDENRAFFSSDDFSELASLHFRCVMAASPFFTTVFMLVVILSSIFLVLFVGLARVTTLWLETVQIVSPSVGKAKHGI